MKNIFQQLLSLFFFLFVTNISFSQTEPSAIMNIESTEKGMLIPRMTSSQRTAIVNPAIGLEVFDKTLNIPMYFNGSSWLSLKGTKGDTGATGARGPAGDSHWLRNGLNTYYNDGNVGIGTTNPLRPLHIKGEGGVLNIESSTHGYIQFYPDGASAGRKAWLGYGGANTNDFAITNEISSGSVKFITGGQERLNILSNGNVGIGIPNPTKKLEVNGDLVMGNSSGKKQIYTWNKGDENWRIGMNIAPGFTMNLLNQHAQYLTYGDAVGQGFAIGVNNGLSSFEVQGSDHTAFFRGNVGIGTTNPTQKLYVNGNIATRGVYTTSGGLNLSSGAWNMVFDANTDEVGSDYFTFRTANKEVMRINTGGKVVIGDVPNMAIPSDYKLYVQDGILTERVRVALETSARWADNAFNTVPSLKKVETYIKRKSHLIGVPSADELVKEGIDVAEMDAILLRQIEWLWMSLIEKDKEINQQAKTIKSLEKRLEKLEKAIMK